MSAVPLRTISAEEWVRFQWFDCTTFDDAERRFVCGRLRSPDEAASALRDVQAVDWNAFGRGAELTDTDRRPREDPGA